MFEPSQPEGKVVGDLFKDHGQAWAANPADQALIDAGLVSFNHCSKHRLGISPTGCSSVEGKFCSETVWDTGAPSDSLGSLVRMAGLEPARLSALPPQSSVSANSTTCATVPVNETGSLPQCKRIFRSRHHCAPEPMPPNLRRG